MVDGYLFIFLVFTALLAYVQHRWRREYDKRRKLEQEALLLDLQQLKNQVNPHFLFNAEHIEADFSHAVCIFFTYVIETYFFIFKTSEL